MALKYSKESWEKITSLNEDEFPTLRDKILELKRRGISYRKISKALGCSLQTVSYHCNPKTANYQKKFYEKKNEE